LAILIVYMTSLSGAFFMRLIFRGAVRNSALILVFALAAAATSFALGYSAVIGLFEIATTTPLLYESRALLDVMVKLGEFSDFLLVCLAASALVPVLLSLLWSLTLAIMRTSLPILRLVLLRMAESERPFGVVAAIGYAAVVLRAIVHLATQS
jgi:hypothetical protein